MGYLSNIKKVCGFYVSGVHLITMILPYVRQQLENEIKFETFFEYNLKENANIVLTNLIINNEDKQKISNINWKNTKIQKYSNIEKKLKNVLESNKEINILVSGSKKYIKEINKILNKIFDKYTNKINHKYITIINCFEVTEFDDNIREILDVHEYILNTSGIHRIEEIFEDYKKKVAN